LKQKKKMITPNTSWFKKKQKNI